MDMLEVPICFDPWLGGYGCKISDVMCLSISTLGPSS